MTTRYNPQSTKRRDLANHTIQLCHKFYTDVDNLSRNYPGESLEKLYESYQNIISTLKVNLRLNGFLTDKVDKGLDRIVSEIKSGKIEEYKKQLDQLKIDLDKNI